MAQVPSPLSISQVLFISTEPLGVPTPQPETLLPQSIKPHGFDLRPKWDLHPIIIQCMSLQLSQKTKLSRGYRILHLSPIREKDAGNYQCEDSHPISSYESQPLGLDVTDE